MKERVCLFALLLVILASPAWAARFVDHGDGTVTDTQTKLVWQKTALWDESLQNWKQQSWEDAMAYCENLTLAGNANWRLPNFRALQTLVDDTRFQPAMDPVFSGGWDMDYWSSTTVEYTPTNARAVMFENGNSSVGGKGSGYPYFYTRCVSGGL